MLKRAALSSLLVFSSGCSFLFMTRPPEIGSQPAFPVECTSNLVAPALDGAGSVLLAITTIVGAGIVASCDLNCGDTTGNTIGIASLVALTATFTASALSGVGAASHCDRVKLQSAACVNGSESACSALSWDPRKAPVKKATPPPEPASVCQKTDDCNGGICIDGYCRR